MHAIAADDHVPLFDGTVCQSGNDTVDTIIEICYFGTKTHRRFVGKGVVKYVEESTPLKQEYRLPVAVR